MEETGAGDRAALKRAGLRRMRLVAGGLLLAMALLLAVSFLFRDRVPALAWLQAFAEAGLVGGLADWFAVVALFRHPLGLPFPHTAIVPRNKDRIGAQLGEFVERNFLTPENILAKLQGVELAGRAARWLARPGNAASVAATARAVLPRLLAAVDDAAIEDMIGRAVATKIEQLDAASLAGGFLGALVEDGGHQMVLDEVLHLLGGWLDRNRDTLRARFGGQSRFTPRFVDSYVVNRFVGAVVDLVEEVVAADRHELRDAFDVAVRSYVERLRDDPVLRDRVEGLKQDMLRHVPVQRFVTAVWGEVKARLADDRSGAIEAELASALTALARHARQDKALLARLDAAALTLIEAALQRFRRQISGLIAGVVQRWDRRDVARNIELEVGRDLQFIRVNGTLVGGAAGLLLHAALMLLGYAAGR